MLSNATLRNPKHISSGSVREPYSTLIHNNSVPSHLYGINSHFAEDQYDYIVNGEALQQIEAFMAEEHTFDEYCAVSVPLRNLSP